MKIHKYSPFHKSKGDCRIVFTNGVFDIIHAGHIKFLKAAKELGDFLVVALNTDASARALKGPARPINNEIDRYEVMKGIKYVDYVVLFAQDTPEFVIQCLPFIPNVIVKGGDYKPEEVITGGIKEVVIIPYEKGYSTTNTIERIITMAPAFGESKPSPCRNCEYLHEDKKKFLPCVNCPDRFGAGTRFRPERTKKGGCFNKQVPKKPCQWPHGCTEKTAKSKYCTEHQRLRQDRRRRYKKKGFTEEEMAPFLNAPISKGPNQDPLAAIQKFRIP